MVRAPVSHTGGRGFNSLTAHHHFQRVAGLSAALFFEAAVLLGCGDLRQIPGIGDETAEAILRQLKDRGALKDFEDL